MKKANEAKVEGIELVSFRAFWFIAAGFIIGFATSTLWEWLYYRRRRLQQLQRDQTTSEDHVTIANARGDESRDVGSWTLPKYRSASVLLESETAPQALTEGAPAEVEGDAIDPQDAASPIGRTMGGRAIAREQTADATVDEPQTISIAARTAGQQEDRHERPLGNKLVTQDVANALHDFGTAPAETSARESSIQEEQGSVGNLAAIARASAMAAATLTETSSSTSVRTAASTLSPPSSGQSSPEIDTSETTTAAERDDDRAKAIVDTPRAAPEGTARELAAKGPTRTVAAHGFSQGTENTTIDAAEVAVSPATVQVPAAAVHPPTTPSSATPPPTTPSQHGRPTDYPDDLAMVKGIGEAYKRRLYATGIYTWRQLAEADTALLRRITRAKPNADIESWQTQARVMAKKYHRTEANFTGPLDDFTRIEGIGAITADILYKAGICTYDQLAAVVPDDLARLVPAPTVGNENDFDGWINNAARLGSAKRRNSGMLP